MGNAVPVEFGKYIPACKKAARKFGCTFIGVYPSDVLSTMFWWYFGRKGVYAHFTTDTREQLAIDELLVRADAACLDIWCFIEESKHAVPPAK